MISAPRPPPSPASPLPSAKVSVNRRLCRFHRLRHGAVVTVARTMAPQRVRSTRTTRVHHHELKTMMNTR